MLRAEDGYFVQFPVEALEDAFLAWEMNGQPLPKAYGHPVRVLVPGHWGETNVKWLSEIELLDKEIDGYWEKRGWHGTGPINTVEKLWGNTRLDDGRIEVAGPRVRGNPRDRARRGVDRRRILLNRRYPVRAASRGGRLAPLAPRLSAGGRPRVGRSSHRRRGESTDAQA